MDWIHFGELAKNATGDRMRALVDLCLLGDLVDDKALRNKAVQSLHNDSYTTRMSPNAHAISHIWMNTTETSMLRKWTLDSIMLRVRGSFPEGIDVYPVEFVKQLAMKLMEQTPVMSARDFLEKSQEYLEPDGEA